ncbi:bacillolysin [Bacillus cereus]
MTCALLTFGLFLSLSTEVIHTQKIDKNQVQGAKAQQEQVTTKKMLISN